MEQRSRDQRRRETVARLVRTSTQLKTSALARVPRIAAATIRGGVIATLRKRGRRVDRESVHELVASLGQLKGVAMKLGQHLSYVDSAVPDDVRAALAALQTHSQPMPIDRVVRTLRSELGPRAAALVETLEPAPIGCASIGQVHRARLADGTRVAVKVQHPGIAEAVESDFGPASVIGRFVGLIYPGTRADAFVREARDRIRDECDYRNEARFQLQLAARLATHHVLAVPRVHPELSTARVLVTDLVDGIHLDEWLAREPSADDRAALGAALFEFYVGAALRWGVLSGDPQPGNYLIADGRLVVVDHGCTRTSELDRAAALRVYEAESQAEIASAAAAIGGEAFLLLRQRLGLKAVLDRLGTSASWRDLYRGAAAGTLDVRRIPTPPVAVPIMPTPTATPVPVPALGTAPVSAPAPVTVQPQPMAYDVVLRDAGTRSIEVMRHVRELTGAGIGEAKQIVDNPPRVVRRTGDRREAEEFKRRLESSGATVEITETPLAN